MDRNKNQYIAPYITGLTGFFHHCKAGIVYQHERHEKDEPVEKEPYDSSTDKAKLLKIEDFGTPDEVKEMA
ncbi:MAG: hypothetical protein LBP23_03770, partial [Treponema sp.]|nr:hypothetical protein [Treponema sp.]